jgi:hypothetical protein
VGVLLRFGKEGHKFDPDAIQQHAALFDKSIFMSKVKDFLNRTIGYA